MRRILFDLFEINIAMSVIILILCLLSGKIRKKYGAGWMKAIWILIALRLIIPYNFSLPTAEIRLLNYPGFAQLYSDAENMEPPDVSQNNITTADGIVQPFLTGQEFLPNEAGQIGFTGDDTEQSEILTAESYDNGTSEKTAGGNTDGNAGAPQVQAERSIFFYSDMLVGIWLLGMLVCAIYNAIACLLFYHKCRRSLRPVADKELLKQIRALQRKLIGKNKVLVYQSEMIASPMLIGILHPRLLLPFKEKQWTMAELEMIMAHELCHYRKKDNLLKLFMTVVCCINWFDPALFIMKRQFFYDMELACDGSVLLGRSEEERETYAGIMLFFAGNAKRNAVFSTGFLDSKKRMKNRIDYMLDARAKKKGVAAMAITGCIVLLMSIIVSCGYKREETDGKEQAGRTEEQGGEQTETAELSGNETLQDDAAQTHTVVQTDSEAENTSVFTYDHDYNKMIRCYGNDVYIDREDGIYRVREGETEEELIFENPYKLRRGMELYQNYLFFCGYVQVGERDDAATIYRMDLDTLEVENMLDDFRTIFSALYHISIYEDQLYVGTYATGSFGQRLGFKINENGEITGTIREDDAFLYREYNDYMETRLQWMNAEYDSEEYWDLAEEMNQQYQAVMDVAACMKMLGGKQIVSRYKDELYSSIYLEDESGTYEYLCDATGYPMIASETGLYYAADERGTIWHVDYEEKNPVKIYEQDAMDPAELTLANYDDTYIYLLQSKYLGIDAEENPVRETYLLRVPRQGGEAEKVYRFEEYIGIGNLMMRCGVDAGHMYFIDHETISLDPDENGMQQEN